MNAKKIHGEQNINILNKNRTSVIDLPPLALPFCFVLSLLYLKFIFKKCLLYSTWIFLFIHFEF